MCSNIQIYAGCVNIQIYLAKNIDFLWTIMRRGSRIFKASAPGSLRSCNLDRPLLTVEIIINSKMHIITIITIQDHRPPPLGHLGDRSSAAAVPIFLLLNFGPAPSCGRCTGFGISPSNISCHTFTPLLATAQVWNDQLGETLALSHSHSSCHTFDFRQIHSAIWEKYVLHIETNTFCNLRNLGLVPQPLELPHSFAWRLSTWEYLINPHKYGEVTQLKYLINQHNVANYQLVF